MGRGFDKGSSGDWSGKGHRRKSLLWGVTVACDVCLFFYRSRPVLMQPPGSDRRRLDSPLSLQRLLETETLDVPKSKIDAGSPTSVQIVFLSIAPNQNSTFCVSFTEHLKTNQL